METGHAEQWHLLLTSRKIPAQFDDAAGMKHLNREHSHLPFLDGLRGLMSFWVVAGHTMMAAGLVLPVISKPQFAVDIFMFVSGFLMAYYFRVRQDREPWNSPVTWRDFYIRRFFRIAPAYYFFLLIALVFQSWFHAKHYIIVSTFPPPWADRVKVPETLPPLHWLDILSHFSLTFGLIPKYAASNSLPDWSIGLEMQFYLALPFIMLLYKRAGHLLATGCLLALWLAAINLFGVYEGSAPKLLGLFPQPTFLPLKLNCFTIGILLAECYYFKDIKVRKSLLLCLLAFGLACATSSKYLAVTVVISALLLVYGGNSAPAGVRKMLDVLYGAFNSRLCAFLADTSYSVYLLHNLVLLPLAAWFVLHPSFVNLPPKERYLLLLGCVALIVYPIAFLVHKFVERPGILLGKQFIRHHRPIPAPAHQATSKTM